MCRINGALFCGNHLPADAKVASKKAQKFGAGFRKRLPCPIDKRHTVYEYDLEKHVLVCNKVKDANAMKLLPYYTENINSGTHCDVDASATSAAAAVVEGEDEPKDAEAETEAEEHTGLTMKEEQGLINKLVHLTCLWLRGVFESPLITLLDGCCPL